MLEPFVSVIIPVYRDWERLALCLSALSKQTYSSELFEIIVVNNDPDDALPANFAIPHNCRIIDERKPGSYAARNTALRQAKGTIIGFTDSDCIPDENWILNAVRYMEKNPSCSRVAGKISIILKGAKPTIVELYNEVYSFPQKWHVQMSGTSVTANLFTYKHVFDAVGGFNGQLMSLGDSTWAKIAGKAGFSIEYVDNVIVSHPSRSFEELKSKEKRLGGGDAVLYKRANNALLLFLRFLYQLRPRKEELKFLNVQAEGLPMSDKLTLLAIRHYLIAIRRFERLRVHMGKKKPSRT